MSGVDTRHVNRDSLFLMAEVRLDGDSAVHRVRVRNLSAAGMMAETDLRVVPGTKVTVELKNLPPVDGAVAWVHEGRFGIAFVDEIDRGFERGEDRNQSLAPFLDLRSERAAILRQCLTPLRFGLRGNQIAEPLDGGQIELAVQQRAAREFAR